MNSSYTDTVVCVVVIEVSEKPELIGFLHKSLLLLLHYFPISHTSGSRTFRMSLSGEFVIII